MQKRYTSCGQPKFWGTYKLQSPIDNSILINQHQVWHYTCKNGKYF